MAKLSHAERSEISKRAWRKRKREGGKAKCAFCGKPIFARGVRMNDKPYHKGCAEAKGAGLKPAQVGKNPNRKWHLGRITILSAYGKTKQDKARLDEEIFASRGAGATQDEIDKAIADGKSLSKRMPGKYNPRKISERKRAPRDAFRYFGAEELNPSRKWHKERVSQLEKAMPYSKRGEYGRGQYDEAAYAEKPGLPNPRVKCPKCGRIMRRVGVGYYICSGCGTHKSVPTTWFPTTEKNPKFKFGPTGFRPPAKWFAKMAQGTSASHFGKKLKELTASQRAKVGQIVGGIWAKYTDATRLDILRKYEPSAVRALANPIYKIPEKDLQYLWITERESTRGRSWEKKFAQQQNRELRSKLFWNFVKKGFPKTSMGTNDVIGIEEEITRQLQEYKKTHRGFLADLRKKGWVNLNPSMLGKRTQMLNCPACGGPNPVSRLNVYLRCNTCGAPLRSVRVRHKH